MISNPLLWDCICTSFYVPRFCNVCNALVTLLAVSVVSYELTLSEFCQLLKTDPQCLVTVAFRCLKFTCLLTSYSEAALTRVLCWCLGTGHESHEVHSAVRPGSRWIYRPRQKDRYCLLLPSSFGIDSVVKSVNNLCRIAVLFLQCCIAVKSSPFQATLALISISVAT